jgi:hypothetical protein
MARPTATALTATAQSLRPDDKLDDIPYIGEYRVRQLKNIVAQAIWL